MGLGMLKCQGGRGGEEKHQGPVQANWHDRGGQRGKNPSIWPQDLWNTPCLPSTVQTTVDTAVNKAEKGLGAGEADHVSLGGWGMQRPGARAGRLLGGRQWWGDSRA